MSGLLVRTEGAVRVLVNSNPAARNAITPALYDALPAALEEAAADPSIGAIVLTGDGDFFCAGGDLRQLATRRELTVPERLEKIGRLHEQIRALRACPKPVIAAVEGGAAGAGMSLALACDLLVAAENAFFTMAYIKVGLSPDGGATAFLSEFLPRQQMMELCLLGERIPAARLHALGAVNRLVAPGTVLDEALKLAERIAGGPANAGARIKRLCDHAGHASLGQQLDLEAQLMAESQGDDEAQEGIKAFFEKRAPDFASLRGRKQ
ncbi:oxepin-CoA hydrolase, alternative type [Massilia sp. Mn16-1_5]|uniref:oxepin-CoA hydrolase, alternative type n=1 Tax=Massilia sp. Mn16-1_5 TaxID=2079199 RepID=UPI00109E88C6|nr:enoyl-CoA hydratase [Massilia sp. Mn16-1_5]THC45329.1 enoyl-CoA hydratase [Massilia sp. Mn16-1_5]